VHVDMFDGITTIGLDMSSELEAISIGLLWVAFTVRGGLETWR
jgi:hypothetical protein